ncbi:uncharacterized protein FIBRA_05313 [Fibroporia radiculosa]|uniref:Uncharacterized protein n=1 Tax=Fibroporia radiculosa TaxID=599839 RepID=J4IAM9_9APHY|nr:uncharacterized protein FIBRA_05313 [Fibroporia radiculosa]CCM03191.1 predicted protein [Fibroporia radiculosa]
MRRITSVFVPRRPERSESAPAAAPPTPLPVSTIAPPSDEHTPRARPRTRDSTPKQPLRPRPRSILSLGLSRKGTAGTISSNDHTSSSASSITGPPTPDDEGRSSSRPRSIFFFSDKSSSVDPPVVPAQPAYIPAPRKDEDMFADSAESESFENEELLPPPPRTRIAQSQVQPAALVSPPPAPIQSFTPASFTRALALNSLHPSFSPPPHLLLPGVPLFPRSCNYAKHLPTSHSPDKLLPQLFHKRILRRLAHPLSIADKHDLSRYAGRHRPPAPKALRLRLDDTAIATIGVDARRVSKLSAGLRRWVDRPCFEDRLVVYLPADAEIDPSTIVSQVQRDLVGVVCTRVSGTGHGVASIEYSQTLELLAGVHDTDADALLLGFADPHLLGPMPDVATDVVLHKDPAQEQFRRAVLPETPSQDQGLLHAIHASPAWGTAPALDVDITSGSIAGFFDEAMAGASANKMFSPPMMTPPLSLTPSSMSPASSGPPTPTGNLPAAVAAAAFLPPVPAPQTPGAPSPSPRLQPYKAVPSPLRIEQNVNLPNPYSPSMDRSSISSIDSDSSTSSAPLPTNTSRSTSTATLRLPPPSRPLPSSPQRAVRFAESSPGRKDKGRAQDEDEDDLSEAERRDGVPAEYIQRIKQQRAEKARFLEAERSRRTQMEEQQRRADRARQEEEDRLRLERERERRERDEERRKHMYAEEVAAARNRRESTRFVHPSMSGVNGTGGLEEWERQKRQKERERDSSTYTRPVYDARRQSEPGARSTRNASPAPPVPPLPASSPAPSGSNSLNDNQRGASQQSHLSPHPATLTPNARSSSVPDVRSRDQRSGSVGSANRVSMISDGDGRDRTSSFSSSSMWNMNRMSMHMGMMHPIPVAVPVPMPVPVPVPMPYRMHTGMEPLLPPAPPFVTQDFGYRPPSQGQRHSPSHEKGRSSGHGHGEVGAKAASCTQLVPDQQTLLAQRRAAQC